jgi:hypothetical protein
VANRIHSILYTDDAQAPAKAKAAITIGTAKRKVTKLPAYSEGRLHRVYVKQASGTNAGFDVEVLASSTPYGDGSEAEAAYNAAAAVDVGLFRVIAKQTATSGNAVDWRSQDSASGSDGHPFINMDQASLTVNERYLYLVIIPNNSADASTWDASVTFETFS